MTQILPIDVVHVVTNRPDYAKKIALLITKGALDLKSGSATLHFNADGVLASIEINARVYNYSKENI
jgi:hypothetical protein